MQGKKQYAEKLFTSFQLSSHMPADNFYRRLKESLDLQWLYKATAKYYGTDGVSLRSRAFFGCAYFEIAKIKRPNTMFSQVHF